MTSKEDGNWKLTLFISKVVLKLIWFDFRNPKRVHSKWFENEVRMFHCFLKSWNPLFETDFKRTWVDLSTLYLRFDYKVEFSKEFEKQSLVCLLEFPMIWKWLGLFQNLKNIYSKEFQNMVEIFSWVLNIKHILFWNLFQKELKNKICLV